MSPAWTRNAALAAPLLLVNTAAVYGQAGWAYDHLGYLGHSWPIALLFAAAVESIGIYLATEAHAALMAGDASARLRFGSYAVGALVGTLNFAHFAAQPGYRPTPLALTFGLLSSISPWLWAIRSRSLNRDRLRELGQVDPRAVRFSMLRWVLYPLRTFTAFRGAVWDGLVHPAEAVAAADARRESTSLLSPPVITATADTDRPAIATEPAPVPAEVVAQVRRELAPANPAGSSGDSTEVAPAPSPRTGRKNGRAATATKTARTRGKRAAPSPRRTAEQTRELAAQLRTQHPEISKTELARLIGISPTRLRQVENSVNGSPVLAES